MLKYHIVGNLMPRLNYHFVNVFWCFIMALVVSFFINLLSEWMPLEEFNMLEILPNNAPVCFLSSF